MKLGNKGQVKTWLVGLLASAIVVTGGFFNSNLDNVLAALPSRLNDRQMLTFVDLGFNQVATRVVISGGQLMLDSTVNIEIGDVQPQLDNTDIQAVSLWARNVAPGDTSVFVDSDGHLQVDILSPTTAGDSAGASSDEGFLMIGAVTGNGFEHEIVSVDPQGHLQVDILSGGGGGLANVDDVAGATDEGSVQLYVRDNVLTTLVPADGDYVRGRVDGFGAVWTTMTNAAGAAALFVDTDKLAVMMHGDAGEGAFATVAVTGSGSVKTIILDIIPGTGASNLGKGEDLGAGNLDTGITPLYVRTDSLFANAGVSADGDYAFGRVDNFGALWVNPAAPTGTLVTQSATASGNGTDVNVSGYSAALIHTDSTSGDRTGLMTVQCGIGGPPPATAFKDISGWDYGAEEIVSLTSRPVASAEIEGYLVDVRGCQILRTVLAGVAGTNGTIDIHVHPVSGTDGLIQSMSLQRDGGTPPPVRTVVAGVDGSNLVQGLRTDGTGRLELPGNNAAAMVDNTDPTTGRVGSHGYVFDGSFWDRQRGDSVNGTLVNLGLNNDVTIASLPLPTGAATSALQTTGNGILTTIDVDTSILAGAVSGTEFQVDVLTSALPTGAATSALQSTGNGILTTIDVDTGTLAGTVSGLEQQVDVITSALPTGAATSALQSTGNISLATLAGAVSGTEFQVDVLTSALPTGAATAANQLADGHNVTVDNAAGASAVNIQDGGNSITIDASSLPLPTGAATSALQTTANGILTTIDVDTGILAGTVSGLEQQVDVITSALPTGAATSALQSTANGILTTIDVDTGTLAGTVSGLEQQVDIVASLPAGSNNIGDIDVLSVIPGTGATALGKAVDSATGATDTGVAALVKRVDVLVANAEVNADGDYTWARVDNFGAMWTHENNAVQELGITELIGINEQVDAAEYGASVTTTLAGTGAITKVCLVATEDGSGTVLKPNGTLILFDADPAIVAGDASITAGERVTILAQLTFSDTDYQEDANGASNCQATEEIYHTSAVFASWFLASGEASFNDAGADDEQLELNVWYRRDSL